MRFLLAIAAALRSVFSVCRAIFALPFRALENVGGGGYALPPEDDENELVVAPIVPPGPKVDPQEHWRATAIVVQCWCAESVAMCHHMPLPPRIPHSVREWAQGLSMEECRVIYRSPETAVSAHLQRIFDLPGVRKVGPLPMANWRNADLDFAELQTDEIEPEINSDLPLAR